MKDSDLPKGAALAAQIEASNKENCERTYQFSKSTIEKGTQADLRDHFVGTTWAELDAAVFYAKCLAETARELTLKGDFDILESMAKQIWDECRHARYAAHFLQEIGGKIERYAPFSRIVPIYEHAMKLADQGDIVSLHAQNNLIGEVQTLWAYKGWADGCESTGKYPELLRIARIVERDEMFHINNGRRVLGRYAVTEDLAERALEAARLRKEMSNFATATYAPLKTDDQKNKRNIRSTT